MKIDTINKKRIISFFLFSILFVAANAQNFIENGITYHILSQNDLCVEVAHNDTLSYLGELSIPSTVRHGGKTYKVVSVGDGAFICCDQLESVILPSNVHIISERAFYGCILLRNIEIGNNIDSIGHYSFSGCENLKQITLPENLRFIGRAAFRGCTSLDNITSLCTIPPKIVSTGAIGTFDVNSFEHTVITVPSGTVANYRSSEGWGKFVHIIDHKTGTSENLLSFIIEGNGHLFTNDCEIISGSTITIANEEQPVIIIKGDEDNTLSHVYLNDEDYTSTMSGDTLICPPISGTTLLKAVFSTRDNYITICHDPNGSLQIDMTENKSLRLRIMPQPGWNIHRVSVDGVDMTSELDVDNFLTIPRTHRGMQIKVVLEKNGKYAVWTSDGVMSLREVSSPIEIPAEAVVADLTSCQDMDVIPNDNPNTLYLTTIKEDLPETILEKNIVTDGHADIIRLMDGFDIYIPFDITADKAEYLRTPVYGSGGNGGWDTIVLPFSVENVNNKDNNEAIDWHHDTDDIGKDFWLRRFDGVDDSRQPLFSNVVEWQPNEPYIIAVPDDTWGSFLDLRGKLLSFEAENTILHSTDRMESSFFPYTFHGTYNQTIPNNSYVINDAGDAFVRDDNREVKAFRAYFTSQQGYEQARLSIGPSSNNVISSHYIQKNTPKGVFNISGVKINEGTSLPHGIYIINGKKEIK